MCFCEVKLGAIFHPMHKRCSRCTSDILLYVRRYCCKNLHRHNGEPIQGLELLDTTVLWCSRSFWRALNWAPVMRRGVSLSDSCAPDRCSFSSHCKEGKPLTDNGLSIKRRIVSSNHLILWLNNKRKYYPGAIPFNQTLNCKQDGRRFPVFCGTESNGKW